MARAKSSGRKQNSSGGTPTRRTAGNAARDPAVKKALSPRTGATRKSKGPAAKKPAKARGNATVARPKAARNASKPSGKKGAAGGRMPGKKPATTARQPGLGRKLVPRATSRKRKAAGESFPPPAPSPESGMTVGSEAPEVQDVETARQTVPPAQPAEDAIEFENEPDEEPGVEG